MAEYPFRNLMTQRSFTPQKNQYSSWAQKETPLTGKFSELQTLQNGNLDQWLSSPFLRLLMQLAGQPRRGR